MKNIKKIHKKIAVVPLVFSFSISFFCVGYFLQYLFTSALVNPYPGVLLLLAVILIAFISLIPTLLIYYSLIQKKIIEFASIFFGSILGLYLIYSIEFITRGHPIMRLYVALHDSLFDTYKINIYYLDYGGFGLLIACLSATICALLFLFAYIIIKKNIAPTKID